MPRKTLEERHIRKIAKVGGGKSYSITIPIEFIRELKFKEKQKVVVKKSDQKIVIEDWKG